MTLGLENKWKTAILAALILVCAYLVYTNVLSGPSAPDPSPQPAATAENTRSSITIPMGSDPEPRAREPRGRAAEFRPVLRSKRSEERIDPMSVDPTLRLEVLARLQDTPISTGGRNLFQFGPPPPPPQPKIAKVTAPEPIVMPQPKVDAPAAPPPPPPIPLKYYGVSTTRANGRKTAFFLDGDQILMGSEGELLKKRYLIVRIGVNSVVVEDTQIKREQPLPLEENANIPG